MTKYAYQKEVEKIQELINQAEYDQAKKNLQELYQFKPVRLAWYHLNGQVEMGITGERSKYYDIVGSKRFPGYTYEGMQVCNDMYEKLAKTARNSFDILRLKYQASILKNEWDFYEKSMQIFGQDSTPGNFESSYKKYQELYALSEYVIYELQRCYHEKVYPDKAEKGWVKWVKEGHPNMGYWNELLRSKDNSFFVVMENERNELLGNWISYMLQAIGKCVFHFRKPIRYCNDDIEIQRTIAISLDSMKKNGSGYEIIPVEIMRSNGEIQDNTIYLLQYLYKNITGEKGFHILASGWQTEELCLKRNNEVRNFRISCCAIEAMEHNFALSFYGKYLSYISNIYQMDCEALMHNKPSKKFSIVIPARNSAATLRYTVMTCLEQSYKGDYEIIISDNSTNNNCEVYNLCQELNDDRIVYLKTPRDLHLPKSFEFAYLHTKGEYVLALGSDDGLLPWALEILDAVTKTYPEEKVIQWERGFYAWPGFGGQEHQFVVPGEYEKGNLRLFYRTRDAYLEGVIEQPSNMYLLPMLYINSCFKRTHLEGLINKTGRLWDGVCQDIYMGVTTAAMYPKILNMRYPLSIAGMSSGSVGANANKGVVTNSEFDKIMVQRKLESNVGGFCRSCFEKFIPDTGTDTCSLYGCLLRMVTVGALTEEYIYDKLDWNQVYIRLFQEFDVRDVTFDRKIHEMRYAASKHGEEFLKWFDEAIYEPALEPVLIDENKLKKTTGNKTYTEGRMEGGGCTLDASKYGVSNIYEAVHLFSDITKLEM